jgi:hypothetical protein
MTRTKDIKAIETEYKGYRFRSRLEARWAVFFDCLGIKWEYEVEGFDLHYNGKYLPDFHLSLDGSFVEIKPMSPDGIDEALEKCAELSMALKKDVWLIMGSPDRHSATGFENGVVSFRGSVIEYFNGGIKRFCSFGHEDDEMYALSWPHKKEAAIAKSARFEFGEQNKIYKSIAMQEKSEALKNANNLLKSVGDLSRKKTLLKSPPSISEFVSK